MNEKGLNLYVMVKWREGKGKGEGNWIFFDIVIYMAASKNIGIGFKNNSPHIHNHVECLCPYSH